jgi:hypothetical protein
MAYDQILAALEEFDLGGDAEADQARINALRRQQMMGAMGGVMDVPGVQSMGQSMFKQASERLGELESPDRPLARALAQAKVLEAVGGLGPDQTSQVKNLVAAGCPARRNSRRR